MPKTASDGRAAWAVEKLIVTVLVCPALVKFSVDGFTVAVTSGTEIVVWYEPGFTAVTFLVTVWGPANLPIAIDGAL